MPDTPETTDLPDQTIKQETEDLEIAFLGLPGDKVLPQYVGAKQDWAEETASAVRRKAGDETVDVKVAMLGKKVYPLPDLPDPDLPSPGDPFPEQQPDGTSKSIVPGDPGGGTAPGGVDYIDTEPVVMVYFDDTKLDGLPGWVNDLEVRVVDSPTKTIVPSSVGALRPLSIATDRPEFDDRSVQKGSVFDASVTSMGTLALVAGGFGLTYYLFGGDT